MSESVNKHLWIEIVPGIRRRTITSGTSMYQMIAKLDAGSWFDHKFAGTKIPTLDEVLAWSAGRLGILVEMKNCPERPPSFDVSLGVRLGTDC